MTKPEQRSDFVKQNLATPIAEQFVIGTVRKQTSAGRPLAEVTAEMASRIHGLVADGKLTDRLGNHLFIVLKELDAKLQHHDNLMRILATHHCDDTNKSGSNIEFLTEQANLMVSQLDSIIETVLGENPGLLELC